MSVADLSAYELSIVKEYRDLIARAESRHTCPHTGLDLPPVAREILAERKARVARAASGETPTATPCGRPQDGEMEVPIQRRFRGFKRT